MNKVRSRIGPETLQNRMKISIEGLNELEEKLVYEAIYLYAGKKQRRIRII